MALCIILYLTRIVNKFILWTPTTIQFLFHIQHFRSINDRFNDDDDDDDYNDYDDVRVPYNNNRPTYVSSQTQTGIFTGNGIPSAFNPNGVNTQSSGSSYRPSNGNTVLSQSSSVSRPTAQGIQTQSTGLLYPSSNGNIVFTQSNNNGVRTESSGVIYPNGQVQITSQKTGKF